MIDIIIPAYIPTQRHFGYFILAIESLKRQTYKNFNAKIVLNGSSAYKKDILNQIIDDTRFQLFDMERKASAAIARNYAIKISNSKYVAQLDADDMYVENKLEKQIDFMEQNTWCGLLGTSSNVVRYDGGIENSCIDPERYKTHEQIKNCVRDMNPICCGSVMFRRSEVFDKGLFYNEAYKPDTYWPEYGKNMNEDWDLWIRCIEQDIKVHVLPDKLYFWREGSSVER